MTDDDSALTMSQCIGSPKNWPLITVTLLAMDRDTDHL